MSVTFHLPECITQTERRTCVESNNSVIWDYPTFAVL